MRKVGIGLMTVIALASAACGTRVERSAPMAVAPTEPGSTTPSAVDGPASDTGTTPGEADPSAVAGAAAGSPAPGGPSGVAGPGGQPSSVTTRPASATGVGGQGAAAKPSSGAPAGTNGEAPTRTDPGKPAVATPAPPAGTGVRSPLVVASVGSFSGPLGGVLGPVMNGGQVWVKAINDRGGVNGHLVKFLVYDDGGDPARHRAQVQEAVERQKVIAFLAYGGGVTGEASAGYINDKGVPVVGMDGGEAWAYDYPVFFPQSSVGRSLNRTLAPSIGGQMVPQGKTRLGGLFCAESVACERAQQDVGETAPPSGLQFVYKARASLAQPDYTAECLAARNQSVEVLLIVLDANSVSRVANSCARQGYRPTFALVGQGHDERLRDEPNLDNAIAQTAVFPYFQSGTPATDEFQAALAAFGKGLKPGMGIAAGWTAGKLFEKAGANLTEPPTREALLRGLWSVKNDTLGGLTLPLTFTENQPAKGRACWFDMAVRNKRWISPDGAKLHCFD